MACWRPLFDPQGCFWSVVHPRAIEVLAKGGKDIADRNRSEKNQLPKRMKMTPRLIFASSKKSNKGDSNKGTDVFFQNKELFRPEIGLQLFHPSARRIAPGVCACVQLFSSLIQLSETLRCQVIR